VLGLELGADDYISKPFSTGSWWPGAAILRRATSWRAGEGQVLAFGPITVDLDMHVAGWTARRWNSPAANSSCWPISQDPRPRAEPEKILQQVWGLNTSGKPHHRRAVRRCGQAGGTQPISSRPWWRGYRMVGRGLAVPALRALAKKIRLGITPSGHTKRVCLPESPVLNALMRWLKPREWSSSTAGIPP